MKAHHLKKEVNQTIECLYCNNNLANHQWDSLFELFHHYKQTNCDKCGRRVRVKVDFAGSGHDCWDMNSNFCKHVGGITIKTKALEEKVNEKNLK